MRPNCRKILIFKMMDFEPFLLKMEQYGHLRWIEHCKKHKIRLVSCPKRHFDFVEMSLRSSSSRYFFYSFSVFVNKSSVGERLIWYTNFSFWRLKPFFFFSAHLVAMTTDFGKSWNLISGNLLTHRTRMTNICLQFVQKYWFWEWWILTYFL